MILLHIYLIDSTYVYKAAKSNALSIPKVMRFFCVTISSFFFMWMHDDVTLLVLTMQRTAAATQFRQVTHITQQLRQLTGSGNAVQSCI